MTRAVLAFLLLAGCAPDPACGVGTCAIDRVDGDREGGELGFRFSSPLDLNGDGVSDYAGGARFSAVGGVDQVGVVGAWSGRSGARLLTWEGEESSGLFGHAVVGVPDLDGDGIADLVAAAPNRQGGGVVTARSVVSGRVLWSVRRDDAFGWDFALAGDQDGDGVEDLFVGAPGTVRPRAELVSGRTGEALRSYEGPIESETFGFYVATLADLDGDGLRDLFVGAPLHDIVRDGVPVEDTGAAFVIGSGSGETLLALEGEATRDRFGEIVSGAGDLDGDGVEDLAVGVPHTNQPGQAGEVLLFSFATGALIERLVGTEPGEAYGRMVTRIFDVDGDGTDDLAIGAPWYSAGHTHERAGRFEVLSGRTREILAEVRGDHDGAWLGWHIADADRMIDGTRRGLLVSSILDDRGGVIGAGRIAFYTLDR